MIITNTERDEARIFQALCTELRRLEAANQGLPRVDPATIEHTRMLRDRYARAVGAAQNASADSACYCVTMPSGLMFRCDECAGVTR